jgi:hypothetical protein
MGKQVNVFCDVTTCNFVGSYQCFRGTCGVDIQSRIFEPEEEGRKFVRNIDGFLSKYTTPQQIKE